MRRDEPTNRRSGWKIEIGEGELFPSGRGHRRQNCWGSTARGKQKKTGEGDGIETEGEGENQIWRNEQTRGIVMQCAVVSGRSKCKRKKKYWKVEAVRAGAGCEAGKFLCSAAQENIDLTCNYWRGTRHHGGSKREKLLGKDAEWLDSQGHRLSESIQRLSGSVTPWNPDCHTRIIMLLRVCLKFRDIKGSRSWRWRNMAV